MNNSRVPLFRQAALPSKMLGDCTRAPRQSWLNAAAVTAPDFSPLSQNKSQRQVALGVLMLAATKGMKIKIEAEGEDAEAAIAALLELSLKGFNVKY